MCIRDSLYMSLHDIPGHRPCDYHRHFGRFPAHGFLHILIYIIYYPLRDFFDADAKTDGDIHRDIHTLIRVFHPHAAGVFITEIHPRRQPRSDALVPASVVQRCV